MARGRRGPHASRLAGQDHAPDRRRLAETLPAGVGAAVGRGQVQHLVPRDRPAGALDHHALPLVGQDAEPDRAAVPVLAARDAVAVAQAGVPAVRPPGTGAASRRKMSTTRIITTGPLRRDRQARVLAVRVALLEGGDADLSMVAGAWRGR